MKYKRYIVLLLALILLLSGCQAKQTVFEVSVDGHHFTVDTKAHTISDDYRTYTYFSIGTRANGSGTDHLTIHYSKDVSYERESQIKNDTIVSQTASYQGTPDPQDTPGETLAKALDLVDQQIAEQNANRMDINWKHLIIGIPMLICGVLGMLFPEDIWYLSHIFSRWRYRDITPTDAAISAARFGNGLCVIIGIILIIAAFF